MKQLFRKARNASGQIVLDAAKVTPFTAIAIAAVAALLVTGQASAQWTPTVVGVENLFDYAALAVTMLGILAVAYGAVAGVMIAVGIAWSIVAKYRGRGV